MKVQFHHLDEFLAELEKDNTQVDRSIVRVTCLHIQHKELPITDLSVVATANIAGYVIRLDKRAGNYIEKDPLAQQVHQRAGEIVHTLQEKLASFGLEVRSGILEP